MLRKGHVLLCQNSKLLFRGQFGLYQARVHKLLVVAFGFAHGLIGHALHLLVTLHRDPDLTLALHVLDVDAALAINKTVKRCRCHRCLLHKKIPIVMMGMMLHVRGG